MPEAVKMVPEGKYSKPPAQTPAPVEARPGETAPCNMGRGKCFPCLAGSSRARKLIVTVFGRFRSSRRLSTESRRKTPDSPGLANGALTCNGSLWDKVLLC